VAGGAVVAHAAASVVKHAADKRDMKNERQAQADKTNG